MTATSGGYAAIADELRRQIEQGALPGGVLPSEADLMVAHGVARTTVRRVLKLLEAEGLVLFRQVRGWHVSRDGDRPGSASEVVAARIRANLGAGLQAENGQLPAEVKLAERYGCSRGPVRQALAQLETEGVVETRPGIGRFVTAPRTSAR